jgi:hypothetical protein
MLKKTFIRLVLLGIMAFASFFTVISATREEEPVTSENTNSGSADEKLQPSGELILETLAGSILEGTN